MSSVTPKPVFQLADILYALNPAAKKQPRIPIKALIPKENYPSLKEILPALRCKAQAPVEQLLVRVKGQEASIVKVEAELKKVNEELAKVSKENASLKEALIKSQLALLAQLKEAENTKEKLNLVLEELQKAKVDAQANKETIRTLSAKLERVEGCMELIMGLFDASAMASKK